MTRKFQFGGLLLICRAQTTATNVHRRCALAGIVVTQTLVFCHFILSRYFYSTSSSPLLQKLPTRSRLQHWYCVGVNMTKRYTQLWVKDLLKVPTWRLERDLNLWPSGRKAPNKPLSHHAPLSFICDKWCSGGTFFDVLRKNFQFFAC